MSMEMRLKARGSTEKEANTKLHKQATAIMRKKGYRDYYTTDPAWKADEMFGGGEKSARVVFTDKGVQSMKIKVKDMDDFKRAVVQAAILKAKGIGPKAIAVALEETHGFPPALARAAVHKIADGCGGKKKTKDALSYLSDKAQQLADYLRMQGSADVAVICRKLKVDEDALLNLIAEVNKNSEKIRIKGDPMVDSTLKAVKIKDSIKTNAIEEALAMKMFKALKSGTIKNPQQLAAKYEEQYGAPVVRVAVLRALELAKLNKVSVQDSNRKKILTFIRDCKQKLQYKDADIRHLTRKDFREKWDKGVFAGKLTPEALQKGKWMGTYKTSGELVTVVFKDASTTDKQIQAAAQEAWDAGSEDAWQMLDDEGGDGVPMQKFLNGMKQQLTHCVTSRARMAADSEGFDSKDTSKVVAAATTIMNKNMGKFLKECRDYYE